MEAKDFVDLMLEATQPQPTAADILGGAHIDLDHPESCFQSGQLVKVMKMVHDRDQAFVGVFGHITDVKFTGEYNPDKPTITVQFDEFVRNGKGKAVKSFKFYPEELGRNIAYH